MTVPDTKTTTSSGETSNGNRDTMRLKAHGTGALVRRPSMVAPFRGSVDRSATTEERSSGGAERFDAAELSLQFPRGVPQIDRALGCKRLPTGTLRV